MPFPKPLLVAAGALLFILAAGFGPAHLRRTVPCGEPTWYRAACPVPEPVSTPPLCNPAWSCGRLARGETGMKPGVWYLKYEDVGGPAMLEIQFLAGAECSVDGVTADCAAMNPPSGSGSSFRGARAGELFVVSRMEFTTRK